MTRAATALLLIAGSFLAGLAILEIGLRIAGYDAAPVVAPDPVRGWALAPNLAGITNSHGLRDRKRSLEKSDGAIRIAVLGDSMAEGIQVSLTQTFPSVLETLLNQTSCLGAPIDVINFAVQGYGTAQQYLTLDRHVWAYEPDIILLAAFPGNDVRDNSRALKGAGYLPFYDLRGGQLSLDLSFRDTASYRLRTVGAAVIRHSRLAQWLNRARSQIKVHYRDWSDRRRSRQRGLGEAGIDNMVFLDPPPPAWETAWHVTEALISQMNQDARARNVEFHLAVLSTAVEVNPDPAVARALTSAIGMDDLSYPRRRLAKLAAAQNFPMLDLVPPLARLAANRNTCLHGEPGAPPCTGHYTPEGHRAVATLLAEHLCNRP